MDLLQTLKIALRALRANKMRSFLTMLGIIIGIAAVIAMMAVGAGASYVISQQIASIGSNIILVIPGSTTSGGIRIGSGSSQTLTTDDVRAIMTECPSVETAAATVRSTGQVVFGNLNWSTIIMGATPELFDIREWGVANGRAIGQQDVDGAAKVCLLGQTVADNLFGSADPVGRIVRIKKIPFTVIGVLDRKGQSPTGYRSGRHPLCPAAYGPAQPRPLPVPQHRRSAAGQGQDRSATWQGRGRDQQPA